MGAKTNVQTAEGRLVHTCTHTMTVQKAHLPQPIPNLGEVIPVPAQAHLYVYTRVKGRATLPTYL